MRSPLRQLRPVAALVAALALLVIAIGPVAAKEGMTVTFDAPIAMDTPGGSVILVGITATILDETGEHPVEGSPMYLKLFGRDGSFTRAAGEGDRTPGHYTMRIEVPAGGARQVEVGIHGTSDMAVMVANEPLTFGGITAGTAQLAPALAPALTPFPRVSAPVVAVAPAAAPAAVATPAVQHTTLGVLAVVGLLVAAVLLVAIRRRRAAGATTPHGQPEPHRAPGA